MARSGFSGKSGGKWHVGPTMYASGYIDGERNGSTISGTVHAVSSRSSGSYGYPVYVKVYCNGNEIESKTCNGNGNFDETFRWSVTTNDACTIWVIYICGQTGGCSGGGQDIWNGGENAGVRGSDGYLHKVNGLSGGSLSFSSYNPWSNPKQAVVARDLASKIKPDGSLTVRWSKASSGSGNTVDYYSVNMQRYRNGAWSERKAVANNVAIDTTSATYKPGDYINLRPGDKIRFDVNTYANPVTNGGSAGWTEEAYGFNYSNEITIYQDGIIYYKNGSGAVHVCTMGYSKGTSGSNHKARYVQVKDTSGVTHSIDVYTTNYE